MDEVELRNIQLSFPSTRTLSRGEGTALEERVDTKFGSLLVAIQGDRSKPAIVTYHDLGLNCKSGLLFISIYCNTYNLPIKICKPIALINLTDVSNFQAFFNFVDMRILGQNFCIYHINAPGQEENAPTFSET